MPESPNSDDKERLIASVDRAHEAVHEKNMLEPTDEGEALEESLDGLREALNDPNVHVRRVELPPKKTE
jgi:hypothetical protein